MEVCSCALVPRSGAPSNQPTLHGVTQPDGVSEYVADGVRVVLLAESVAPYRATVRVERLP